MCNDTLPRCREAETLLRDNQSNPPQTYGALNYENGTKVSYKSLYRHTWSDKHTGGMLYVNLWQRGKKCKKRGAAAAGRGLILGRIDIAHRPAIIDTKSRLGDWVLDSIIGAKHRGTITSMVERKTNPAIVVLLDGPTSEATKEGIIRRQTPHKKHVLTLTSDNGKEFADHAEISEKLGSAVYFCTPYLSWERGLNENTTGLVQQHFPKDTNFAKLTVGDV